MMYFGFGVEVRVLIYVVLIVSLSLCFLKTFFFIKKVLSQDRLIVSQKCVSGLFSFSSSRRGVGVVCGRKEPKKALKACVG